MMKELGLDPTPEAYLDAAPWQLLACANHNFLLAERRLNYLRCARRGEQAGRLAGWLAGRHLLPRALLQAPAGRRHWQ